MKKYLKFMIIIMSLFTLVGCVDSGGVNYYSSVQSYNKDNDNSFFDFYHPKIYFDSTFVKKTLSDINKVKIYYYLNTKDQYQMSFDIGDLEIIYNINSENYSEELKKYSKVIVDGVDYSYTLYMEKTSGSISALYPLENKNVEIIIRTYSGTIDENVEDIIVQIMIDALKLNQKK